MSCVTCWQGVQIGVALSLPAYGVTWPSTVCGQDSARLRPRPEGPVTSGAIPGPQIDGRRRGQPGRLRPTRPTLGVRRGPRQTRPLPPCRRRTRRRGPRPPAPRSFGVGTSHATGQPARLRLHRPVAVGEGSVLQAAGLRVHGVSSRSQRRVQLRIDGPARRGGFERGVPIDGGTGTAGQSCPARSGGSVGRSWEPVATCRQPGSVQTRTC